jgi:hypothetical protein
MLANLINPIARLLRRLGACGNAGLIVGMLTGGLLAILHFLDGPLAPSPAETIRLWLVTALFGWLVLIGIFVALARWAFSSVALPALVNAALVTGLTVLICRALGAMVCIARRPRCGTAEGEVVPEVLSQVAAIIAAIGSIVSVIIAVGSALGYIKVIGGVITIVNGSGATIIAIGGAAAGGALAGLVTAIALIVMIGLFVDDRCIPKKGLSECAAGVVVGVLDSFDEALDELLPFSAMHDRVDLLAKSRFWDVIEDGQAFVHCTDQEPPRRSEILRCYFYDRRVCGAAQGALYGGIVGGVGGIIAAAAIAAAIGCATIILCIFALIAAILIAAAAVLIGALAGGQIGKAASTDDDPTAAGGEAIANGQLVTIRGNMVRREYDESANVLYFARQADFHGMSASPQPFSYCEIDDELAMDGCERAPDPIR